jgi:hypothetical protein
MLCPWVCTIARNVSTLYTLLVASQTTSAQTHRTLGGVLAAQFVSAIEVHEPGHVCLGRNLKTYPL